MGNTSDHEVWTNRLLYVCRLALQMLPEVLGDVFGRFTLDLRADVLPPRLPSRRLRSARL